MRQLGDVLLNPVGAEVRLSGQRRQIPHQPQVALRARGLHRLRVPSNGCDRRAALTADERQGAGDQVLSRREHEILIADSRTRPPAPIPDLRERRTASRPTRAAHSRRASATARSPSSLPTASASRRGTRARRCRTARAPTPCPPRRRRAPCRAGGRPRSRTRRAPCRGAGRAASVRTPGNWRCRATSFSRPTRSSR